MLIIKLFSHTVSVEMREIHVFEHDWISHALANVLDGLQNMRDDSALCQALADHLDFADLAASVAAVVQLRRKLADHDLTATERDRLDRLAVDPCEWVRNEAKGALDDLANPLPDQVAVHDGDTIRSANLRSAEQHITLQDAERLIAHDAAEDFESELRTFEARGVTIEDHGRLNYIRANAKGALRDRAGALLVQLAGVAK